MSFITIFGFMPRRRFVFGIGSSFGWRAAIAIVGATGWPCTHGMALARSSRWVLVSDIPRIGSTWHRR